MLDIYWYSILKIHRRGSRTLNSSNNEITWSTKSKIIKDENGENVPYLEITEVINTL